MNEKPDGLKGRVLLDPLLNGRPDRSEALPADRLTWRVLTEEPAGPHFCANSQWYGYGELRGGFRGRMVALVGWEARNPRLRSGAAYDLAYDRLYDLLPDCRDCLCAAAVTRRSG